MTAAPPRAHPCHFCGAPHAPYGYGWPGARSSLPPDRRGYLWACATPACRAQAEARQAGALGRPPGPPPADPPPPDPPPAQATAAQAQLL